MANTSKSKTARTGPGGPGTEIGPVYPPAQFYMVVVRDTIGRHNASEIRGLLKAAKQIKAEYGGISGLIDALEEAERQCK